MNEFAATFWIQKKGKRIEVEDIKCIELPRTDGPDIDDVINDYELMLNIEATEAVESLPDGEYDCLLAGTWDYEYTYDSEGNKDAELIIEIEYFVIRIAEEDEEFNQLLAQQDASKYSDEDVFGKEE